MSEEKLYAVKNDDGIYWDFKDSGFWILEIPGCYATAIKERAEMVADGMGGHVVTLVEEPEKVVLTKEQAETVEHAHTRTFPALYIAENGKNETLLMEAYVNGYAVAKEKKYYVKVPHTEDVWYCKAEEAYLRTICSTADKKFCGEFTESEIEYYGLQDCERVEVADDEV